MTTKQKLEWLNATGRECPRHDLRKEITERLEKAGVTRMQVAKALRIPPGNFYNGITGKQAIPLSRVEQILWMLDPNEPIPND